LHNRELPKLYVSGWDFVKRYRFAYGLNIMTILDLEQWPQLGLPFIEHPPMKRKAVRLLGRGR